MDGTEIYSSRYSKVQVTSKVGSKPIEGIQSIDWKVNLNRTDVIGTGQRLRLGVEYGIKQVSGTIRVKSACDALDQLLLEANLENVKEAIFTLDVTLSKKGGVGSDLSEDTESWPLHFVGCYLDSREMTMDVNGTPIAVYNFTAADVTGG